MKIILFIFSLLLSTQAFTQQDYVNISDMIDTVSGYKQMTEKQLHQFQRKHKRDSIREQKRVWTSILGGPSYTPEASLGVGGALLMSFRIDPSDTISQRSFIPIGFNISLNGTFVAAGGSTLFFNENKFRIYTKYGYRTEPSIFYGIGFNQIEGIERLQEKYGKDSITAYHKSNIQFYPRFVWEVHPNIYLGGLIDFNYSYSKDMSPLMRMNQQVQKYGNKYHNIGIGGLLQYDTRDDVATPTSGILLSAMGTMYGKYLGGNFNYEILEFEYRQFQPLFKRRSTLGWIVKSQIGFDNVPYTELPSFGSPFDLRGYLLGKYRDKSMAYGIVEYRHMFMTKEDLDRGSFWAKFGAVAWVGTGTLGKTPADWNKLKLNYGAGLRIQIQPGKNFRLDFGKEPGQKLGIYFNMTEAF